MTLGYPGEGPPALGGLVVGCHNEAGLRSGDRLIECVNDFIQSRYNIMLLQEHKLNRKGSSDAKELLRGARHCGELLAKR